MTEVASHRGSCGGGPVLPVVPRRLRRLPASLQVPRTPERGGSLSPLGLLSDPRWVASAPRTVPIIMPPPGACRRRRSAGRPAKDRGHAAAAGAHTCAVAWGRGCAAAAAGATHLCHRGAGVGTAPARSGAVAFREPLRDGRPAGHTRAGREGQQSSGRAWRCGDGGYLRRGVGRARGWRGWGGPKGVGFRFISFPVGGFIYDCEEDDCEIASPKAPRFCSSGLSGAKVAEPRLAANSDVDDAARRHVDGRSASPSDDARRALQVHGVLRRVRVAGLKTTL